MSVDRLLSRLEGVRERGSGQWIARCSAHDDRSPSLSIKLTDDGAVLLKCFAGCPTKAVVNACGLDLSDLFPPKPDGDRRGPLSESARYSFRLTDLMTLIRRDGWIVALAGQDIAAGKVLSARDHEVLMAAVRRLQTIVDMTAAEKLHKINRDVLEDAAAKTLGSATR